MRKHFADFVRVKDLNADNRERISSLGVDVSIFDDCCILPGFTDVHVHLREPGFLYKETMRTGTAAAAAGGFTDVFSMPNLNPCPDNAENLRVQLDAIKRDALVNVYPYGAITVGEAGKVIAELEAVADNVIAFTDDGKGVSSDVLMLEAMQRAKALGKPVVAHCEDERYPREAPEAEWKQLERDIELVRRTGCSYHVCHISTEEAAGLVRKAKEEGLDVTCETAPHYLTISDETTEDDGRFKMNPPIKFEKDRQALLRALKDGTIDMIATDHAPHSAEEKNKGFDGSAFGIIGMETAFPVLYTELVDKGIISLKKLTELLYDNPRKRFGLEVSTLEEELAKEKPAFALWDLNEEYDIDPGKFLSMGRSTPFDGWRAMGRCRLTVASGRVIQEYKDERHWIYDNK